MDKRYQVFVSSTYTDLIDERTQMLFGLLEANCFPMGMEFFPPANEQARAFIQKAIAQCDFYVVMVAGRYGSIDPESGLSFTEMEYDMAVTLKKPIIAFYHESPNDLPSDKRDEDPRMIKKREAFRRKITNSGRLCRSFVHAKELNGKVVSAMFNLQKTATSGGWIRSESAESQSLEQELQSLRAENDRLQARLGHSKRMAGLHSIDAMPNHVSAQPSMKEIITEALRSADHVTVKVMSISLHFSSDFLVNEVLPLLSHVPFHKKIRLELLMVSPDHLNSIGQGDWSNRGKASLGLLQQMILTQRGKGGLFSQGRLELVVYQYVNLPHWHGILINDTHLFMGRVKWTIDLAHNPPLPKMSVGQEVYRQFSSDDEYGGSDRIDMFRRWFEYYIWCGKEVLSFPQLNDGNWGH